MQFQVELTRAAQKDLKKLNPFSQQKIIQSLLILQRQPFPEKKKIKKIKGVKKSLYRLRVDTEDDSYRVFYSIENKNLIFVLRIIAKKDAKRILKNLR